MVRHLARRPNVDEHLAGLEYVPERLRVGAIDVRRPQTAELSSQVRVAAGRWPPIHPLNFDALRLQRIREQRRADGNRPQRRVEQAHAGTAATIDPAARAAA